MLLFLNIGDTEATLIGLLELILVIYCLYDIIRSDFKNMNTRLLWIIIVLIAPIVGSLIYLLIGRRQRGFI